MGRRRGVKPYPRGVDRSGGFAARVHYPIYGSPNRVVGLFVSTLMQQASWSIAVRGCDFRLRRRARCAGHRTLRAPQWTGAKLGSPPSGPRSADDRRAAQWCGPVSGATFRNCSAVLSGQRVRVRVRSLPLLLPCSSPNARHSWPFTQRPSHPLPWSSPNTPETLDAAASGTIVRPLRR